MKTNYKQSQAAPHAKPIFTVSRNDSTLYVLSLSKNTPPKAFATAKAFGIIEENHLGRPPHGKARRRRPPQSNGY